MSLLVVGALAMQDAPPLPAEFKVNTNGVPFYAEAARSSKIVHKGLNGDVVTGMAREEKFLKCDVGAGKIGFALQTALIAKDRFKPGAATDEDVKRMTAQGAEVQRGLNPITEKEHIDQSGPEIKAAYESLDALMKRPDSKADRGRLESELAGFRKTGGLGEFSSVK
jgi:hypothetical protein